MYSSLLDAEVEKRLHGFFSAPQVKFHRYMVGALLDSRALPPGMSKQDCLNLAEVMATSRFILWPEA